MKYLIKKFFIGFLLSINISNASEIDETDYISQQPAEIIRKIITYISYKSSKEIDKTITKLIAISTFSKKFYSCINNIEFFKVIIDDWVNCNKSILPLLKALLLWPDKTVIVPALRSSSIAMEVFNSTYNAAIIARNTNNILVFLKYGADPDFKVSNYVGRIIENMPAIVYAAGHKDLELIKLLLGAQADINSTDQNGYTALMVAAQNNSTKIVDFLLTMNADASIQANDNATFKSIIDRKKLTIASIDHLTVYRSPNTLHIIR